MNLHATPGTAVLSALGLAAAALLLVFAFVPKVPAGGDAWGASGSTYSPGPEGIEALYLLLEREGFTVERWRRPGYSTVSSNETLWFIADGPLGVLEKRQLLSFVDRGGTLVARPKAAAALLAAAGLEAPRAIAITSAFVTDDGSPIEPGDPTEVLRGGVAATATFVESEEGEPLVASWSIGQGRVVAFGAPALLQNDHVGRAQNGVFLVHLARALGTAHVFDEIKTGFAHAGIVALLFRVPYRAAVAQLGMALLVALVAATIRRRPIEPVQPRARRSTRDHVEAVGHLWARSGDTRLPLAALARAVDDRAASHVTSATEPFIQWAARTKPRLAARAAEAKHAVDALCREATPPRGARARAAARELRTVEREVRAW
jgi:Domain of unknown function (DUF4350)